MSKFSCSYVCTQMVFQHVYIVYEGMKNVKPNAHRHWGMYEMFSDMAASD